MRSCFRSSEILAVMVEVSIRIPRNTIQVVGPSTLEGFTGAFIVRQIESIVERLSAHSWELGAPAVKNHQDNATSGRWNICVAGSSGWLWIAG